MTDHTLLLVNLGSPDSPSPRAVRRYLGSFLMDKRVIDLPWPLRRALVSAILLTRPRQSAKAYASIWWPDGSPLLVISRALQQALRAHWTAGSVALAMRYGSPSIGQVLRALNQRGVKQITLAPLYPQFAESTVGSTLAEVQRVISAHGLRFNLRLLKPFYQEPAYIEALAASAQPWLEQEFDHLLMSFHGLPERHIRKLTDPIDTQHDLQAQSSRGLRQELLDVCYRSQCLRTAELLADHLALPRDRWSVSFQSRLGHAKWIDPYTESKLSELAQQGVKKLLVISPAFVADCVETLEEIAIRGREQFIAAGGQSLQLIPCLNSHPNWVKTLALLAQKA
ncbi:ferrochelatase [Ventosimonas gracilis]|uniref:Ferrochelatase n=1 Tax=Ventosimonas gracilis TaxID=1680762 RepID=A0A139SHE8_9GAMM|nr:ferrochelatase [Ventosimonas gracilis]KXU33941.1 ferrochelatase [Ventosimonas gracilis]